MTADGKAPPPRPITAPLTSARLLQFVADALADFRSGSLNAATGERADGVILTVPAPLLPPEQVFAALKTQPAVFYAAPKEPVLVGLGDAHLVRRPWPVQLPQLARRTFLGLSPGTARWLGAQSFSEQPSITTQPPWHELPSSQFALPRFLYERSVAAAAWHIAWVPDPNTADYAAEQEAILTQLQQLFLLPVQPISTEEPALTPLRSEHLPLTDWTTLLQQIADEISAGRLQKVVAARQSVLHFATPLRPEVVLARLLQQQPQATRFALRRGQSTFLGATPERLLRKTQLQVQTEALAGSLPRNGLTPESPEQLTDLTVQLQASIKDRHEHALVVQAIAQALQPHCQTLSVPELPMVRVLPHLLHLLTPIAATLRQPTHLLQLMDALHPTPAVGGTPQHVAVQFIAQHEPAPRGLYAGPIGYFDEHGDGELVVAIRSALLQEQVAYLYAGAGIVSGSKAAAEYAETTQKQQVMLAALGVAP